MQIAVLGLGYVGLPLALSLAKKFSVTGFDINSNRIDKLKDSSVVFTSNKDDLRKASFYIIAVPTPVNEYNQPDLNALFSATRIVGSVLKKGDIVVYESTVYPGCTEDECAPLLEEISGLKYGEDFKVGYSPERINPGDKVHTIETVCKVVSGCDDEVLEKIASVYEAIVDAGIYRAPSIKIAEAAKIIENTQRDVNIAFMNELSIIFGRMGINTYDVLEAAKTKWNFLHFGPGLVGGHCIGVDPYYLVHKAEELKYHPQIINAGRFINDSMGGYVGKKIVKNLIAEKIKIYEARVLVQGITFKENVDDIRNSKVVDLIKELRDYNIDVDVIDEMADAKETEATYGITLLKKPRPPYDAIVLAVAHDKYSKQKLSELKELCKNKLFLFDIKGVFRKDIKHFTENNFYWSL
ncbi:MAG: nucleotide sugar dehydrogenase [Bacteroidales bacterium]|jgi:UDP-N-acetyl-D-galactosamine dehydrogenase|nr:nucleotide sugar dehydrogenase [Bacteroidales bacterium]